MVGGITVGALFEDQKVFDVVVWGRPELRDNIDDVRNLMINSESGPRCASLRLRTSASRRPPASSSDRGPRVVSMFPRR